MVEPHVSNLHTYFLFPFSIDREVVQARHDKLWHERRWIDALDDWIAEHDGLNEISRRLGSWKRAPFTRFDVDSRAYQEMVFFHPFVRRIFFDTGTAARAPGEQESLLRRYQIPAPADGRLRLFVADNRGRSETVDVTDLRLYLFANGIGILSIGVEAMSISARQALWINEMMRKIFPSSGRQRREGRFPAVVRLTLEQEGDIHPLVEDTFDTCNIRLFQPPLSALVASLLYFTDYPMQEYEPVLDERMIVYSYLSIDPTSVPAGWKDTEEYEQFFSRALWVDQAGEGYRYQPDYTRGLMQKSVYRRWAHQGTLYGFSSFSNLTGTIGESDRELHQLREGFLLRRMFDGRYYLMMMIALFYRATLLDFAERVALVSRRLYFDLADGRLQPETLAYANNLRSDFLNFYNYWHFDELANKDEESEHFRMQCDAFQTSKMLRETDREVERMHNLLSEYYQSRNTSAVNRLAMISMILGAGSVITGYFGMNFGHDFESVFFKPTGPESRVYYGAIVTVTLFALAAISFGVFLVVSNWADYRDVLMPRRATRLNSIRKINEWSA